MSCKLTWETITGCSRCFLHYASVQRVLLRTRKVCFPSRSNHTKVTFEQADKDKDGTLDREEAKAVCGEKFDVMDTDKDGTLTRDELNACGRKKHDEHDKLHEKR